MSKLTWLIIFSVIMCLFGCNSGLPKQADPLENMEVSRALFEMPDDEVRREELPLGIFTGIEVGDSRLTLEDQLEEPEGILVTGLVGNSPAVAAGVRIGDIILEASIDENESTFLQWPSDWFKIEQTTQPDSVIHILCDRAGRDFKTSIKPVKRLSPPERLNGDTFREESKVGIIVRNASEVEAQKAGLTRGEGSVVVGLARTSPWKQAGLLYGDIILEINNMKIKNPQDLIITINGLDKGQDVELAVFRDDKIITLDTTVSQRQKETKNFNIPFIFSYNNKRGIEETSIVFGIFKSRKTKVASEYRFLWLINYTTGDSNRLEEVEQ